MKLTKDGEVLDFDNMGTIDAFKAAGWVEYIDPPKPESKPAEKPKTTRKPKDK